MRYYHSDSILTFEYFFLFKVIKTSLGYLILYGNHFEPKSGYSNLYVLTKDNNNWVIKPCNFKFASPVCQIFNLKDTIHLITAYNIYKSDDSGKTWFPVFNIDKSSPFDFIGFYYTNNTLYTTTRDGVFYKNTNPNGTKIASTKSNFKSPLFSVFPNPANSNVTFSINNRVSQVELFLFDMNGKQVFNKKIAGLEEFKLNIEFLPSGNYQYLILSNTETQKGQFSIIK